MGKLTKEELLSIVDRYGYDLSEEYDCVIATKRVSSYALSEHSPIFGGGDKHWQLKRIAAWILDKDKEDR